MACCSFLVNNNYYYYNTEQGPLNEGGGIMEYRAVFGISCGVSHGFGLKYADYVEKEENIFAETDWIALKEAAKKSIYFSLNYLSNPSDDLTTVTLIGLFDESGRVISQKGVLKSEGYDNITRFVWKDEKLVRTCSTLEHLLRL